MTCRLYTPVNGRCIHGYSDTVTDAEADRVVSDFHAEVRLVVDLGEDPTVRGFVPALTDAQQAFVAVADVGTTSGVDPLTAYHDAVHDAFDQHSGWSIRNDTSDRQLFDALTEGTTQSLSNVAGDIDTAGGVIGVPDEQQAIGLLRELLGLGEGQETLEEDRTEGEETDPDGRGSCETVVVSLSGAVSHVDYDVLLHLDSAYERATVVEDPDESPEERVERLVEETADRRDTVAVLDEVNDRLSNSDLGVELRYTPETRARIEPLFTILTLVLLFWGGLFTTWSWYQFGGQFRLLLADRFLFVWLARLISAYRPLAVESHTVGAVTFASLFGLGLLSVVWKTGLLSRGGRDTPADTTDPEQTAEELVETLELLSAQIDSNARETLDEVVEAESTVSITDHPVLRKAGGTLAILFAGLVGGGVYWLAQSPSVQRVVSVTVLCGVVLLLEHRGPQLVNVLSNGFEFVERTVWGLSQSSRGVRNEIRRRVSSTVDGIISSHNDTSNPAEQEVAGDGQHRDSAATTDESDPARRTTTEDGAPFEEFTVERLIPLGAERALAYGPTSQEDGEVRTDDGFEAKKHRVGILDGSDGSSFTFEKLFSEIREVKTAVDVGEVCLQTDDGLYRFDAEMESDDEPRNLNPGATDVIDFCLDDEVVAVLLETGEFWLSGPEGRTNKQGPNLDNPEQIELQLVTAKYTYTTRTKTNNIFIHTTFPTGQDSLVLANRDECISRDSTIVKSVNSDKIFTTITKNGRIYRINRPKYDWIVSEHNITAEDTAIDLVEADEQYIACASDDQVWYWRGSVPEEIEYIETNIKRLSIKNNQVYILRDDDILRINAETDKEATRDLDTGVEDFVVLDCEDAESCFAVVTTDGSVETVPLPTTDTDEGMLGRFRSSETDR